MNDTEFTRLIEEGMRRPLRPEEANRLRELCAAHPERQAAREEEEAFNRLLRRCPDVRVASNFTTLVMQQVEGEESRRRGRRAWLVFDRRRIGKRAWIPRFAVGTAALAVVGFLYLEHQWSLRAERAESVAQVTRVAVLPSIEVLRDYDAIRALSWIAEPGSVDGGLADADAQFILSALP